MKSVRELTAAARSVRRFRGHEAVSMDTLVDLVDLARLTPSAANMQPLKYVCCAAAEMNERVFETLGWAGYLPHWPGPAEDERPAAYIIICHDTLLAEKVDCDHGIAAQTIMLGAAEKGLSGCILASINREKLAGSLGLEPRLSIKLVIALGKAAETVNVEEVGPDGSIKYWRDEGGVHHVPKRVLTEVIVAKFEQAASTP